MERSDIACPSSPKGERRGGGARDKWQQGNGRAKALGNLRLRAASGGAGERISAFSSMIIQLGECVFCVFTNAGHANTDLLVQHKMETMIGRLSWSAQPSTGEHVEAELCFGSPLTFSTTITSPDRLAPYLFHHHHLSRQARPLPFPPPSPLPTGSAVIPAGIA